MWGRRDRSMGLILGMAMQSTVVTSAGGQAFKILLDSRFGTAATSGPARRDVLDRPVRRFHDRPG